MSIILEHSNVAPYIVQQTQGVAAVMLLITYRKSNIGCWPCPLDYYFWAFVTALEKSPILQQEDCRSFFFLERASWSALMKYIINSLIYVSTTNIY